MDDVLGMLGDVDPDDLAIVLVHLLRERGVRGVHVRLVCRACDDWSSGWVTITAIEIRAHLPLRLPSETYHAKTYAVIPCMEIKMDQGAAKLIERALGGKE